MVDLKKVEQNCQNGLAGFNYNQVDKETADYLHVLIGNMKRHVQKARYEMACELAKAHDRLAKNGYGCFYEWCESLGLERTSVKRELSFYNLIGANCTKRDLIESLPKSLQDDMSKKSAPPELTQKVLDGEITTHKQWREEKKALEAEKKQLESEKRQAEARVEETEQKLAEAQEKEAGYKATIREQADKLANTGTSSEYLALKEAFDKQAESLRSAREQAEMYRKNWTQERENASKAYEIAQKNVEQSPKYQKLLKENETIKAHIQGKSLEQHAKETNQPELRRNKKDEAKIIEAIDSIAAALSKLPAKVEMSEWAEVYIREQEMLLSFTRETLERGIPNLQMLLDEFKGQTGIRRIK